MRPVGASARARFPTRSLVEAIEELFVPLAIHNNRPGADARALVRFEEPSWNNPVVRFLDGEGRDVIPRRDRVWATPEVAGRMVAALEAAQVEPPPWLRLVETEEKELRRAVFAMHCFWEGEVRLGSLTGVVTTRAAWLDGREVVEVRFDPGQIDYARLVEEADRMGCAARVWARDEELEEARDRVGARAASVSDEAPRRAPASDQKRYLRRSPLALLPLTPMQRTKVNAALGGGTEPRAWISPRQAALLARIREVQVRAPERLEGLRCPERVRELAAYTRELEARLGDG